MSTHEQQQPLIQRFGLADLDYIRRVLVDLYLELYADNRDSPFFSRERFIERLNDHAGPGWETVIAFDQGEPSGYAYGCPLPPDTVWWEGVEPTPPPSLAAESGRRTFALLQLMVKPEWRGTGIARRLHDELLKGRFEERVTLLVEQDHPRVGALYERWGYASVASSRPYADGPLYDLMLRPHARQAARRRQRGLLGKRPGL